MDQNLAFSGNTAQTAPISVEPDRRDGKIEKAENDTPHTEITATQAKTRIDLILRDYGLLLGGTHRRNLDHDIETITNGLRNEHKLSSDPNTAFETIIKELAKFYVYQVQHDYIEGDLYGTTIYLVIIYELYRAMNIPLPTTFFLYSRNVRKRLIEDSPLEHLFNVMEMRMSGNQQDPEPSNDFSKQPLADIPHGDKAIYELVGLVARAKQDKNWELALEYQKAIAERPNENRDPGRAIYHLALAYENVRDYKSALETLDRREAEYPMTDHERGSLNALRQKLQLALDSDAKPVHKTETAWPRDYTDLAQDTDLAKCDTTKLITYSMQAQKRKDWKRVVHIQGVICEKLPNKATTYIVLAYALEQLGRTSEADAARAKAKVCSDYVDKKANTVVAKKPQPDLPAKVLAHDAIAAMIAAADSERVLAAVAAQPPAPKPKKPEREVPPSNINTANFTNFLSTFIAQAATWQSDAVRGATWKKVPESDKQVLREYLTGPAKWKLQAILKGSTGNGVLQSLETIERHIGRGSIDTSILNELQQRFIALPNELKTRIADEAK